MNRTTLSLLAAAALGAAAVLAFVVPDANAVPFNKTQVIVANSIAVRGYCAEIMVDGGVSVETTATATLQTALPDGGTSSTTVRLENGEPCEIGAISNLTLANVALCARAARGLER